MDKNTDVGAINSRKQLDRIEEMVAVGETEGAQRWDSGCELPTNGFWFRPTVFSGVSQTHRIAQEEIFGPVVSVLTFRTPAEAVAKANNTPYGLSAGVWTEKGSRILWMADQLRAGVVWANTFNKFDPTSPFGGYKESGYGREGGPPRARGLRDDGRPTRTGQRSGPIEGSEQVSARVDVSQDVQALHRREVPPQRERAVLRGVRHGIRLGSRGSGA
jgi:delta 1-pyrroline-5-carboxylate dehydrogenase